MNHAIAFSDKWDSAMTPVIAKYKERALIILVCAGRKGGDHAGLIAEERLSAEMTRRGTWHVQNEKCYVLCFVPVFVHGQTLTIWESLGVPACSKLAKTEIIS